MIIYVKYAEKRLKNRLDGHKCRNSSPKIAKNDIYLQKILKQCSKGFKTTNKLQLSSAQVDRLFTRQTLPRHGSKPTPKEWSSPPSLLAPPFFILPISSFWLCPVQNRTCIHHQSIKWYANGHTFKVSHISEGFVVYVFP